MNRRYATGELQQVNERGNYEAVYEDNRSVVPSGKDSGEGGKEHRATPSAETETNPASSAAPWKWIGTNRRPNSRVYLQHSDGLADDSYVLVLLDGKEPSAADARLIAAAPSMYAALKEVIATHCPDDKFFCGACSPARDVLALVDGK